MMAETTRIAWTDATFSPWIGCTKVGPGCDHCYAEAANHRFHAGENWGPGAPRRRTSPNYWRKPFVWDSALSVGREWLKEPWGDKPGTPVPKWVFCASQSDVFDNEVDPEWRTDLWRLIRSTPHLRWQLVTKRVGNVPKMLPRDWQHGLGIGRTLGVDYRHVGIIATMVDQEEWLRDGPKLLALKQAGVRWVGVSYEPALGPIRLAEVAGCEALDWMICGGESAQYGKCRTFHLSWPRDLLAECRSYHIPFFMKQLGSWPFFDGRLIKVKDRAGADPGEWPADLRVREMPQVYGAAT